MDFPIRNKDWDWILEASTLKIEADLDEQIMLCCSREMTDCSTGVVKTTINYRRYRYWRDLERNTLWVYSMSFGVEKCREE